MKPSLWALHIFNFMIKVLVSGASGIVGYGILRSLRKSGENFQLIGTTIYKDTAAEIFSDVCEQAVATNDPNYMDWLINIIQKYQIDIIIPGLEVDLLKWAEHIPEIEKCGAKAVLNNQELIFLCQDKWKFYEKLAGFKSPYAIETTLNADFDHLAKQFGLPFLLKPRCGMGSKGIVRIADRNSFLNHQNDLGSILMAQPIVGNDDDEYTTSAFCDGKGGYYASMTLKRKLSESGYTEVAEVILMKEIDEALLELCKYFKPVGPTNFQFRMHKGVLKLLEINPRMSSSTSLRTAFGYNENVMAIDYYLKNKNPKQPLIKKGRAIRYTEDYIIYEDRTDI